MLFRSSSFLLVASSIVVVHTIQNSTYTWTGILSAAFGILAIWGTVKTYETEVDKIYPKENIIPKALPGIVATFALSSSHQKRSGD